MPFLLWSYLNAFFHQDFYYCSYDKEHYGAFCLSLAFQDFRRVQCNDICLWPGEEILLFLIYELCLWGGARVVLVG